MVNSPYWFQNSTMYPQTVEHLNQSKRSSEERMATLSRQPKAPAEQKAWPLPAMPIQIPDPDTSTYMHTREAGAKVPRRPQMNAPVRYEDLIGSKFTYGHKAMQDNVWEKKKLKTRGKPITMRGDCQKGELFAAQREIQSKLLSRYPTMIAAFKAADADRSGTLTRSEIKGMLTTLRVMCRSVTLDTLLDIVDTDGSSNLDYQEFAHVLTSDAETLEMMLMGES